VVDTPTDDPVAVKRALLDWATLFADMDRQLGLKVEARKDRPICLSWTTLNAR
jgi:hypothetical protein